jgi:hypothetical protein
MEYHSTNLDFKKQCFWVFLSNFDLALFKERYRDGLTTKNVYFGLLYHLGKDLKTKLKSQIHHFKLKCLSPFFKKKRNFVCDFFCRIRFGVGNNEQMHVRKLLLRRRNKNRFKIFV